MSGQEKLIVWVTGVIVMGLVIITLGTSYLYHWKKIEMAKAGYEERQVMVLGQLAWQKVK